MNISKFNIGDRVKTDVETVGYSFQTTIGNLKLEEHGWMYHCNDGNWYEEFDLILVRAI